MTEYQEEQVRKIISKLEKRKMKVYEETETDVLVFWKENGKSKFGALRKNYYGRYGVSTSIALTDGSKHPWFSSNEYAKEVDEKIVEMLLNGSWETELPAFNVNMLTTIQS